MKLITEEIQGVEFLVEEKNGKKNYHIHGPMIQMDEANQNNRIYESKMMIPKVEKYIKEFVDTGRALGELGHPDTPQINLDRACILIKQLKQDKNLFLGKAQVLDTPMGNITKGLLDGGVKLGVSTRGVGSLKPQNGYHYVQDDYVISAAADVVSNPSAQKAFVQGIMENVNWFYDNGQWKMAEASEDLKRQLKTFSKREIEETALKLFENYISKL